MNFIVFINNILKYILITLSSFYILFKILNNNKISNKTLILVAISCIALSILYTFLVLYVPSIIAIFTLIFIMSIINTYITKQTLNTSIVTTILSFSVSFVIFMLSILLTCMFTELPFIKISSSNPIVILIASPLQILFINKLFSIKRFTNGFSFIKNNNRIGYFGSIAFIFCSILIFIFSILQIIQSDKTAQILILLTIIIASGTFIWIKRNITLDYQDRMKNRKIENLEKELADKEKINAELTEEIKSLTMINHQYNSRIKAAKQEIEKLAFAFKNGTNTEFSTELSEVTKLVNNLSSEYSNKVNSVLKYSKPLPKTNVKGVDSILEHMKLEATKKNIDFDLKVNCSVKHLIEKFISQSELETLISDHVKDAIIAVGYSESTPRSICVIFDIIDNCYRFSVYDSGIDFQIDTLVNLGLDAITTHKDDGGTGLGFLTTFGTLDKCKASLVIDEINFKNSNFSKSVNIIFDEKHEYIVRSSRTEEIKKFDKNSRIILQNKD